VRVGAGVGALDEGPARDDRPSLAPARHHRRDDEAGETAAHGVSVDQARDDRARGVYDREVRPRSSPASLALLVGAAAAACRDPAPAAPVAETRHAQPPDRAERWTRVARSAMAEAFVEKVLYERPGAPHFYVHVRIVNRTAGDLGAALGYWESLYPNQWGASATEHRQVIDEGRMTPPPLDAALRAKIVAEHRRGALPRAAAHAAVDYYRDFNASSRADVEAQSRGQRFVILAMDGRVDVTDGTSVERVTPPPDDDTAREVTLDVPVAWSTIPDGALVFSDR
jgi:hypothetical protein